MLWLASNLPVDNWNTIVPADRDKGKNSGNPSDSILFASGTTGATC